MNTASLVKLVDAVYSEPTVENGWHPGGYDDIAGTYGLTYADHFSYLVENRGEESANIYFSLLMNDDRPDLAESYFRTITGQEDQEPPVSPDEGEEGNESAPAEDGGSDAPPEPDAPAQPAEAPPAHAVG